MVLDLVSVNRIKVIQKANYIPLVRKSNHLPMKIITSRCPVKSKCKIQVYTEYKAIIRDLTLIDWNELL